MRTYVTSLGRRARLAHIGNAYWTACGFICTAQYLVTEEVPEGRLLCPRCEQRYAPRPAPNPALARAASLSAAAMRRAEREDLIFDDLRRGRRQPEIARAHRIGLRTYSRDVSRMRRRVGARTLFHFGYLVGLAERDTDAPGTDAPWGTLRP